MQDQQPAAISDYDFHALGALSEKQGDNFEENANTLREEQKESEGFLASTAIARRLAAFFALEARRRQRNKRNYHAPKSVKRNARKRERDARRLQRVLA